MPDQNEILKKLQEIEKQKAELEAQLRGSGAIAQGGGAKAVGEGGTLIEGNMIVVGKGGNVFIGEQPVEMKAKLRATDLGRYLEPIIAHNRYFQLQGIRSGGKPVNIELEQIYITLRTNQQRTIEAEKEWLRHEAEFAPGEMRKRMGEVESAVEVGLVRVGRLRQSVLRFAFEGRL